jgi:hypothetical protein
VQATPDLKPRPAAARPFTQTWVTVTLLIGAAMDIAVGIFLSQFMSEPSAVGRSKAALVIWSVVALATAVLAIPTAIMLVRQDRPGRPLAWLVSILMTATLVPAIAGIPALIGLWSSRKTVRP